MGETGRAIAHARSGPRFFSVAAGLVALGAAACSAPPAIPRLAAPAVVNVRPPRPAAARVLRVPPQPGRRGWIGISPTPPIRESIPPAFLIGERVWCPRPGPGGVMLPAPVPQLTPEAVVRFEVLTGAEARRYAGRCAPPADSVVRVVTRWPLGR